MHEQNLRKFYIWVVGVYMNMSVITSLIYYESFYRCGQREILKVKKKHTENRCWIVGISGSR